MKTIMMCTSRLGLQGREMGAAAIEFALVVILLMMMVGAIIEFGRVFWYYDALTKATRDGARMISLAQKSEIESVRTDAEDMVVAAASNAQIADIASLSVWAECLDTNYQVVACVNGTGPVNVRVRVSYAVTLGEFFPILLPSGGVATYAPVTLTPQTTMRYLGV